MRTRSCTVVWLILGIGASTAAAAESTQGRTRWALSFEAFGPVKIGMKLGEAEEALGARLGGDDTTEPCHYGANEDVLPGVSFMFVDGRIVRIDVSSGSHKSAGGAHLGMTENELKRLHPRIEVKPHEYVPEGHYFVLTSPDGQYGIVFETDGKAVTRFRGGRREPVSWVEGCQ